MKQDESAMAEDPSSASVVSYQRRLALWDTLSAADFKWLLLGQVCTSAADWMEQIARSWLIWELTHSPAQLGLVSFARAIPILLWAVPLGVALDRLDKRRLLGICQMANVLAPLVLAVLILTGQVQAWHVYLFAFVTGSAMIFQQPIRTSLVPYVVEEGQTLNAMSLNQMANNITRVFAPGLAGALVGIIGTGGVFTIEGLIFALGVATTALMKLPPTSGRRVSIAFSVVDGFRHIGHNRPVLSLLVFGLVPVAFIWPYMTLLPIFADQVLEVGAWGLGILTSAPGIGAVVGALGLASLRNFKGKGKINLLAVLASGLLLAIFSRSPWLALSLPMLVGHGMAMTSFTATLNTLLITHSPKEYHGRVMGAYVLVQGISPFANLSAGLLAQGIGAPLALSLMCGTSIILTGIARKQGPQLWKMD
ncbi:MAG: MFS transporter [Chloroflexi bacterium]|nr:MFS transporter [Chloroflexota bacterium]